jgi:uncharacterized protein (TIGR03437 family)
VAVNEARQTAASSTSVVTQQNLGSDKRTRLMLYATGLRNFATNNDPNNDLCVDGVSVPNFAESVIVEIRTSTGTIYQAPVEFAGAAGTIAGLDLVEIVLPPALQGAGVVDFTLKVAGQSSNKPTIIIN